MNTFSHSLISLIALLGPSHLASGLSIPNHDLSPRQATPGFKCLYEPGWEMCNEKGNRGCWVRAPDGREFNNRTDYEKNAPAGLERVINLNLSQMAWDADGTIKPEAKLFNKIFPGPLIEACWGET